MGDDRDRAAGHPGPGGRPPADPVTDGDVLPIVQAGDPVLRRPCRPVADTGIPHLDDLVAVMHRTMTAAPGVGLAANQVGLDVRLLVAADAASAEDDATRGLFAAQGRVPLAPLALVDATVEAVPGSGTAWWFEGCLSIPGWFAVVPRATAVRVRGRTPDGDPVDTELTGWPARILQHETDHLDGRMYVDRMITRTYMSIENYRAHWRFRPISEVLTGLGAEPVPST